MKKRQTTDNYVFSTDELVRRGIERRGKGYYKPDLLDKYLSRGWLSLKGLATPVDRFSAARRFQKDFYLSRFAGLKASDYTHERVDGSGVIVTPDKALDARQRYFAAMRNITPYFRPAVRMICIENEGFDMVKNQSYHTSKMEFYAFKLDLCRGLDDLVDHYRGGIR